MKLIAIPYPRWAPSNAVSTYTMILVSECAFLDPSTGVALAGHVAFSAIQVSEEVHAIRDTATMTPPWVVRSYRERTTYKSVIATMGCTLTHSHSTTPLMYATMGCTLTHNIP